MLTVSQNTLALGILSTIEDISSYNTHPPCATIQRCVEVYVQLHKHPSDIHAYVSHTAEAETVDLLSPENMLHAYEKCLVYPKRKKKINKNKLLVKIIYCQILTEITVM